MYANKKHDTREICLNRKETELTPSRNYRASPAATLSLFFLSLRTLAVAALAAAASATFAANHRGLKTKFNQHPIKRCDFDVYLCAIMQTTFTFRERKREKKESI